MYFFILIYSHMYLFIFLLYLFLSSHLFSSYLFLYFYLFMQVWSSILSRVCPTGNHFLMVLKVDGLIMFVIVTLVETIRISVNIIIKCFYYYYLFNCINSYSHSHNR